MKRLILFSLSLIVLTPFDCEAQTLQEFFLNKNYFKGGARVKYQCLKTTCDFPQNNKTTDTLYFEWTFFNPISFGQNKLFTPVMISSKQKRINFMDDGIQSSLHYLAFQEGILVQYIQNDSIHIKPLLNFNAQSRNKPTIIDGRLFSGDDEYVQTMYYVIGYNYSKQLADKLYEFDLLSPNTKEHALTIYNISVSSNWGVIGFKVTNGIGCFKCGFYDQNYIPTGLSLEK